MKDLVGRYVEEGRIDELFSSELLAMDDAPLTYEAALDLGAAPATAFLKATLPQIKPGIITGAMIAFTLSIDDVVISFFTAGSSSNLSILIFSMARLGINPKINALSTIIFVVVMLLLYLINKIDSKNRKFS